MDEAQLRKGLEFILSKDGGGCSYCVATRTTMVSHDIDTCNKCRASVGLEPLKTRPSDHDLVCPCFVLERDEALKRAALYLEETAEN